MIIATLKLLPGGDTSLSATERTTTGEVIRPPATVSWLAFRSRLCPGLSTRAARRGAGLYGREQGRDPSGARSSSRLLRPGDHESEPNRFGHDLTARPAEADALAFESPDMQAFYASTQDLVVKLSCPPERARSCRCRRQPRYPFDEDHQPATGGKEWPRKAEVWPLETTRADFCLLLDVVSQNRRPRSGGRGRPTMARRRIRSTGSTTWDAALAATQ